MFGLGSIGLGSIGLGGHLGSTVSALVDGQLDDAATERAWAHVACCAGCRSLVENEGWVKRRVAETSGRAAAPEQPPADLVGSLFRLRPDEATLGAWAQVRQLEQRGRNRRRAGLALVGAGSVSAAVLGFTALGGTTLAPSTGVPATQLSRVSPSATPLDVAPAATVRARQPRRHADRASSRATHAVAVGDNRWPTRLLP
jgi:hypothetical protein